MYCMMTCPVCWSASYSYQQQRTELGSSGKLGSAADDSSSKLGSGTDYSPVELGDTTEDCLGMLGVH